jgi:hypothetical protein
MLAVVDVEVFRAPNYIYLPFQLPKGRSSKILRPVGREEAAMESITIVVEVEA